MREQHYDTTRYGFGKNWAKLLQQGDWEDRAQQAVRSLRDLLQLNDLSEMTFLDIGCGSGLFSQAAYRLGAKEIFSFDFDENSVACCKQLHAAEGKPDIWKVAHGSILDDGFISMLGTWDVVYSWGVLHHTGNMWTAISNASKLVKPNGFFVIGIYNWLGGRRGTETWKKLKKWYCEAPKWKAFAYEYTYILYNILYMTIVLRNPFKCIKDHGKNRGMSWFRDVSDWLGGYPYEAATAGQVLDYMRNHSTFELIKQNVNCGLGVSEFVFRAKKL